MGSLADYMADPVEGPKPRHTPTPIGWEWRMVEKCQHFVSSMAIRTSARSSGIWVLSEGFFNEGKCGARHHNMDSNNFFALDDPQHRDIPAARAACGGLASS